MKPEIYQEKMRELMKKITKVKNQIAEIEELIQEMRLELAV